MNSTKDTTPATVPVTATQAGEVRARWAWTEPSVWTDRMLTALETGVKGGTWFSLMDKVFSDRNLFSAYGKVAANGGAAGDPTTFRDLDRWVRMRLRSILRKRAGLRGRGRGADHQRWPNRFFAEHGLYSLQTAHVSACQSSCR